ncbi:hypothetical protein [Sphingomonas oryzagri]
MESRVIETREWKRSNGHGGIDTFTVSLVHRPDFQANEWQVKTFHAYDGGGGFGYNPVRGEEAEARAIYARRVAEQDAKQALADADVQLAGGPAEAKNIG